MKIYIICSVRGGTPPEIEQYVHDLEAQGHIVHFPPRPSDCQQDDPTGWNICRTHLAALKQSDEVHVFWDVGSKGSHFDLGMAFALVKKIKLVKTYHPDNEGKSYVKVMRIWEAAF